MTNLALGMIVRDAAPYVERCLRSAAPYVEQAVIIDTGSEDDTVEVVQDVLSDCNVPLTLNRSPWVSHAHNRSELLTAVQESGADYCLMLDADMELVVTLDKFPELTADEYSIPILDRGLRYPLPLLTSTKKNFFYAGVTHAYLSCADGPTDGIVMAQGVELIDHGGGGHRPGKIERDVELLSEAVGKDPRDRRSWFYLAQSYRDLDRVEEAIWAYRVRASLGGWDQEVYLSLYYAGALLCRHVNYYEGAQLLLQAASMKHNRAEALRALAGSSEAVANKIPLPFDEVLFVEPGAYTAPRPAETMVMPPVATEAPDISPGRRRKPRVTQRKGLNPKDVSVIIPTRGNVDLTPTLENLPYDDIVIADNSKAERDMKIFARYAAIPQTKNPVILWLDDDVIFTAHEELMKAYEPGKVIANMDQAWVDGAGYGDRLVLLGAGSLCDADIPKRIFDWYLSEYQFDDDLLLECDFAFGVLAPWKRVDLGYDTRSFTDDADRLYRQPGQTERKWAMIERCEALKQMP